MPVALPPGKWRPSGFVQEPACVIGSTTSPESPPRAPSASPDTATCAAHAYSWTNPDGLHLPGGKATGMHHCHLLHHVYLPGCRHLWCATCLRWCRRSVSLHHPYLLALRSILHLVCLAGGSPADGHGLCPLQHGRARFQSVGQHQ